MDVKPIFDYLKDYKNYINKCIYIDYLQLLRGSGKSENRTLEVTEISRTLKNFNVPILALSQINRKVEDRQNKRPQLSDLGSQEVLNKMLI